MEKDTKEKIIKCVKNAFYSFGVTLGSILTSTGMEGFPQALSSAGIAFIVTFFIAFGIVFKKDLYLDEINKKGKAKPFSNLLLF